MEDDYLELSQFPYNSLQFPYNSHQSPLRTIGFLTIGIRAIYLDMDECDRRELWKELRQMVNKVSKDVKTLYESHNAVLEKVKTLAEFNKAMNEELSRLQEGLENMMKEELQYSLDSMKFEEKIKFQESTVVVASWDVDFCVKVDNDIHVYMQPLKFSPKNQQRR